MAGLSLLFKSINLASSSKVLLNNRARLVNLHPSVATLKSKIPNKLTLLDIPEKPKRPLSPYMKFVTERQSIICKENPNLKQADIIKKCAEEWRVSNEEFKKKYDEGYLSECTLYNANIEKYFADLTEEQKEALKAAENEKKNQRKKRKLKKLYRETNKPKKPAGPYTLYILEHHKMTNLPFGELMSNLKDKWSKLPESEKKKYIDQYYIEKLKYETAVEHWENQMLKEGRIELVRRKVLDETQSSRIRQIKEEENKSQMRTVDESRHSGVIDKEQDELTGTKTLDKSKSSTIKQTKKKGDE